MPPVVRLPHHVESARARAVVRCASAPHLVRVRARARARARVRVNLQVTSDGSETPTGLLPLVPAVCSEAAAPPPHPSVSANILTLSAVVVSE